MKEETTLTSRHRMRAKFFEAYFISEEFCNKVYLHHHDFFELYFFLSGNIEFVIEGKVYKLVPGDVLIIKPQELHMLNPEGVPGKYERCVIYLSRAFFELIQDQSNLYECFRPGIGENKPHLFHLPDKYREKLIPKVKDLVHESAFLDNRSGHYTCESKEENSIFYRKHEPHGDDFSELIAESLLFEIIALTNRYYRELTGEKIESTGNDIVDRAVTYINDNLTKNLSLDKLAAELFVNKFYLVRIFKKQTGVTPYQYIIKKRLILSKELMYSLVSKPNNIYRHTGFSDYTSFYKAFKKEYSQTPKEFYDICLTDKLDKTQTIAKLNKRLRTS